MSAIPEAVGRLIETFDNDIGHYRSPAHNETLCRIDFINPMFCALGWDMENRQGYADAPWCKLDTTGVRGGILRPRGERNC
jgi:hypothetical protein